MRVPRFKVGFVFAFALFCLANIYSYYDMPESSTMDDGFVEFGWPFAIYAYGGFWTHSVILWTGLIGNLVLAICVGRVFSKAIETFKNRSSPTISVK